jgi:hypothetical protein
MVGVDKRDENEMKGFEIEMDGKRTASTAVALGEPAERHCKGILL